jgi:hypothetical protein
MAWAAWVEWAEAWASKPWLFLVHWKYTPEHMLGGVFFDLNPSINVLGVGEGIALTLLMLSEEIPAQESLR